MREHRAADHDLVVVEDPAVERHRDVLRQPPAGERRDLGGGDHADVREHRGVVPLVVVDARRAGAPRDHRPPDEPRERRVVHRLVGAQRDEEVERRDPAAEQLLEQPEQHRHRHRARAVGDDEQHALAVDRERGERVADDRPRLVVGEEAVGATRIRSWRIAYTRCPGAVSPRRDRRAAKAAPPPPGPADSACPVPTRRAGRGRLLRGARRRQDPTGVGPAAHRRRRPETAMSELPAGSTVDILYGRTGLRVPLPAGARATVIGKPALPKLPDPRAAVRDALARPVGAPPFADAGAGAPERLHPDLRHHATRAQPPVPAAADRRHARRRHPARVASPCWSRRDCTGRTRAPSSTTLVGDPWVLADRARREPLRARRRRARRPRRDAGPAHAGQARPPLRRGGPADRDRARRAALHGRLLRRAQGDRARRRARGHDPHVPQRALHGGPGGDPVQPRRQSAARGAARDRADAGRGLRGQHGDRRGARPRPRQLRRSHRKPPRRGGVRGREHAACPWAGALRRC